MQIRFVEPNAIEQGQDFTLTIKGDGFVSGSATTISGTGVEVLNTTVVDAETLTIDVSVSSTATKSLRDVSVTPSGGSTVTLASALAVTNFQGALRQMRLLIGERIKDGRTESDTFFKDEELVDIILRYQGNLYLAASECWSAKEAEYAKLVDITESGSERKLSQMFKQANTMAATYGEAGIKASEALIMPAIAKTAAILDPVLGSTFINNQGVDLSADPFYNPFLFVFVERQIERGWPPLFMYGYAG